MDRAMLLSCVRDCVSCGATVPTVFLYKLKTPTALLTARTDEKIKARDDDKTTDRSLLIWKE
jgi:hypothetical protein